MSILFLIATLVTMAAVMTIMIFRDTTPQTVTLDGRKGAEGDKR